MAETEVTLPADDLSTEFVSLPFWINEEDPLAWDTVYLGGDALPGIASLGGSALKRVMDKKKAKGKDKANLKDEGDQPAELEITLLIYNQIEWNLLQEVVETFRPPKAGGERKPVSIEHPLTQMFGITMVYVTEVAVPSFDKAQQTLTVSVKCVEWVPKPKPVVGGAGTGQCSKAVPKNVSDMLLEQNRILNEFRASQGLPPLPPPAALSEVNCPNTEDKKETGQKVGQELFDATKKVAKSTSPKEAGEATGKKTGELVNSLFDALD
jgi:uncharacterized protein YkwD